MRSAIYFAGRRSLDFGICVEYCPPFRTGGILYEKKPVPGRNGELVLKAKPALSNYTQPYEIWFSGKRKDTIQDGRDIALWLLSQSGYARLEDTYDPETYRMALFAGPLDVENWMLCRGRATLEFDCMPQRFFKSGEQPVAVQSGARLYNAHMPALPLIRVSGTGSGTLTVGQSTIAVSGMTGGVTIDSDTQNAYDGQTNKNNSIIVTGGFPVLGPGETAVLFSGGITSVEITPRWWTV